MVPTAGSHDLLRQQTKMLSRYCFVCRTPWTLTVARRDTGWVIFCKDCGTQKTSRSA
ncbi:MAG: hypothetical protein ABI899_06750 [Actinomycetota bacterium]